MTGAAANKVAISEDFLSAFAGIPQAQQNKVLKFITEFREDPGRPSINYEKIEQAKDANLRSVRVDKAYRAIVLKPAKGSVYVLLWVDHHDEAYRWAANKVCSIHPETGSLQVIAVDEQVQQASAAAAEKEHGLFDKARDRNLIGLGVPEELLPLVRAIKTEADLDRHAEHLPQEAAEALYMLASGYSVEEVQREQERPAKPVPVDPQNFAAALDNPDSQRRFYVVDDENELKEVLAAPLEKWRVFLHPSQRKLVENDWGGPVRVLGGAGTGKTVVAMHRARWLATNVFTAETDRILFTTFTRNLAEDIHANLKKICPDQALNRIEVVNLDRWVSEFLRKNGYEQKIVYGDKTGDLWARALTLADGALDLPSTFYREEWDAVVQPQAIETLDQYQQASRVGRGVRLNRKQRQTVWPVFEEYRVRLSDAGLREGIDAMRDARKLLEQKGRVLPYKAIVVDEAQDMGMQAFLLLRAMLPADDKNPCIFIVGDAHQRIYRHKVVLGQCGIDIRGRGRRLRINYRTTDETRRWAVALLQGVAVDDLDGGIDSQQGYRALMHGIAPRILHFDSFDKEVAGIVAALKEKDAADLAATCLVTRTNELLDQYASALKAKGVETYRVRRTQADDRRATGLRLATMHRVKGLEFDRVFIAACNDGVVPLDAVVTSTSDETVQRESDAQERALLYVAATRARREVVVTGFGKGSRYLDRPA